MSEQPKFNPDELIAGINKKAKEKKIIENNSKIVNPAETGEKDAELRISFTIKMYDENTNKAHTLDELSRIIKKYPQLKDFIIDKIEETIEVMNEKLQDKKAGITEVFNFPNKIKSLERLKKLFK